MFLASTNASLMPTLKSLPSFVVGEVEVTWIQAGNITVDSPVARVRDHRGDEKALSMQQTCPVRRALPQKLLEQRHSERLYPDKPLVTTQRIIDTFFPIALGGTGCIPGPFGAGKTVLQNLISRYSAVDIVVVVACGERAGEVVETISEFPKLTDPRTGGSLMDRTIIICVCSPFEKAKGFRIRYPSLLLGATLSANFEAGVRCLPRSLDASAKAGLYH